MVGGTGLEPVTSAMKSSSSFSRNGGEYRIRTYDLPDVNGTLYP